MKSQKPSFRGMSRSHLFLIELIIVILFFSFAGAVTVQVFSKAHELAQDTTALNGALMVVQTAAETDKTARLEEIDGSPRIVYFNESWEITGSADSVNPADSADASNPSALSDTAYTLTTEVVLEERPAGVMAVYHYTAAYYDGAPDAQASGAGTSGDRIIYELETKKYYPGEVN